MAEATDQRAENRVTILRSRGERVSAQNFQVSPTWVP